MKTVLLHDNYGINTAGHFTVAGIDTVGLAKEYGIDTPSYSAVAAKFQMS
mgnify:CR=1 FL=1